MPCLLRSTERSSHAKRCGRVRPGWDWAGPNRPAFDDFLYLGERSGEAGGDGVLWPLLGILLYACIFLCVSLSLSSVFVFVSLRRRHMSWLAWLGFHSLSLSLTRCVSVSVFLDFFRERERESLERFFVCFFGLKRVGSARAVRMRMR
jgi:hypothetical protein